VELGIQIKFVTVKITDKATPTTIMVHMQAGVMVVMKRAGVAAAGSITWP
jgi:hypothetical protein